MAKIAILGDTHWGVRNDDRDLLATQVKFTRDVFLPRALECDAVLHLGDLFDRRKYLNFQTAKDCRAAFLEPLVSKGIPITLTVGNHDDYYRDTNSVNAPEVIFGDVMDVVTVPTMRRVAGLDVACVPWVTDENRQSTGAMLSAARGGLCVGHLELIGFDYHRGQSAEHGQDPMDFQNYDMVLSGHYHTRSVRGNVRYVGATAEYTWSDYDDPRGFSILDTETMKLEFVQNELRDHHKISLTQSSVILDDSLASHRPAFVKLTVAPNVDRSLVDEVVGNLEGAGHHNLQVIQEVHDGIPLEEVPELGELTGDTVTLMESVIDSSEFLNKDDAKLLIRKLYGQAQEMK